ncbi:hypothetical protein Aperf_G00000034149 [Anoplocephala perfoliata]
MISINIVVALSLKASFRYPESATLKANREFAIHLAQEAVDRLRCAWDATYVPPVLPALQEQAAARLLQEIVYILPVPRPKTLLWSCGFTQSAGLADCYQAGIIRNICERSRLNSCTMDTQQPSHGSAEEAEVLLDEDVSAKGNMVFSGLDEPVKFVTINKVPPGRQVLRILSQIWQLKPPTLVISIHGSYANLKKRFTFTMKKGLWKTMESAGCWIIGDGLDRGLGKIAGEAVAEYVEAYGGDEMLAIGVTPMHSLKFKHIFNTNAPTIYYPIEEDMTVSDLTMTVAQKHSVKRFHLDKNYGHLVMISSQTDPDKQKKPNELGGGKQEQLVARNEQLIQTRIAVERMVIGWRTAVQERLRNSTIGMSESTHGTVPPPSGLPSKQPKFRASIEPPSPPSKPQQPIKLPSKSEETYTRGTDLLSTVEMRSIDGKEESPTNLSSSAERRMSRLSVSSPKPPSKPMESETGKDTLRKEPVALQIPICGILAGGDRWSLQQVYASMTINHCPFVVIRSSPSEVLASRSQAPSLAYGTTMPEKYGL